MIITTYSTQRVLLKAPPVLSSIVLAIFMAELLFIRSKIKSVSFTVVSGAHLNNLCCQRYAAISALLKPLAQHFRSQFLPASVTIALSPRLTLGHAANLGADAGTMKVKRQSNPVRLQEKVAKPSKAIPTLGTPASTAA
ncbi:MAG: hypothetical protein AB8H12_22915, partial [Lewinella sp.]